MPTPGFALNLIFGEMAEMLLDGQRVMPTRLQELGYKFKYENVEDAVRRCLTSRE